MTRVRAVVDDSVAAGFGVPASALHRPEVLVVPGPAERILAWRLDAACVLAACDERIEDVRAAVAGRSPEEVFDAAYLGALAGDGWTVFGPSVHSYVDSTTFSPVPVAGVERLEPHDSRLEALRDASDPDEWAEGGFPGDVETALYGITGDDGALVAAGNMTEWRGQPADVGLLTRADQRGRGLGRAVASAMTAEWLPIVGVVRYRALGTNVASLAVARSLGFEPYGSNYAVRLTGRETPG